MRYRVDVESAAGARVGAGPITTVSTWEHTAKMNAAGDFSFLVPAIDPKAAYLLQKRGVKCYGEINGSLVLLDAGIIDKTELAVNERTLVVSGNDRGRELSYNFMPADLEIGTTSVKSDTGPQVIAAYFFGAWALDTVTGHDVTSKAIYHKYDGETALNALIRLTELSGDYFYLDPINRKVVWMWAADSRASGIKAVSPPDPERLETDTGVCIIARITQTGDAYDGYIYRLYMIGAGAGGAKLELNGVTATPPAGYVLGNDSNGYYLEYTANSTPGIRVRANAKDVTTVDELYDQAYEYLSRHISENVTYDVDVVKLDASIYPGQTLRVIYHGWTDDFHWCDLDSELWIQEITTRIDERGVRISSLKLSTSDAAPMTGTTGLAGAVSQTQKAYTHGQPVDAALVVGNVEAAQDAVGAILTDSNSIDFTYTDATPEIHADVKMADGSGLEIVATGLRSKLLGDVMGMYLALPELRGFWPMSSVNESANILDISGQGRILTNTGPCSRAVYADLLPYLTLSGSGQYLTRADEAGLDITGALTVGVWMYAASPGNCGILSKWLSTGNQRAYLLYEASGTKPIFVVSTDGSASTTATHSTAFTASTWQLVVGRFTPSTEVAVFLDNVKVVNTTSIPATIFNSSAAFEVGAFSGAANLMTGSLAFPFVCAAALSDALLTNLYNRSKILFGL